VSGRDQPSYWQGDQPEPSLADRTKKSGELIYQLTITPMAYPKLLIKATSTLGEQIAKDLITYEDFAIPPNLRGKTNTSPQAIAPMPDFDPGIETYEYEYVIESEGLEADDAFTPILLQLAKAVNQNQIEKWRVWALKPNQKSRFEENYPDYDEQLVSLATRHAATLAVA
jgi:hypothetical protein